MLHQLYADCTLCPRMCHVNRLDNQIGRCHVTSELKVARAALHYWEETCISGERGSGAVFFSGCNVGCIFCQNQAISTGISGKNISISRLAEIFLELQAQGAHNINLVTPDHYTPSVIEALHIARSMGLKLPIICNCSGYMLPQTVKLFKDTIDIWLPDFKYADSSLAQRYSHASDYFEIAKEALACMYEQVGDPVFDEDGMMQHGIIVRHLVLPNHSDDSKRILSYLYQTYKHHIYISIMNQFTPLSQLLPHYPELNRKVSDSEYDALIDYALSLGVENGFIQEGETAEESFIPSFDCEGV